MTPRFCLLAALFGLLGVIAVAYHDAPENVFHFDDEPNITDHSPIKITELTFATLLNAGRNALLPTRPLPNMTFALDWYRGGGDPRAFQQTNLALHGITAVLVFLTLFLLLGQVAGNSYGVAVWAAFLSTAVWAVHPIQIQSVTYIVQRMTLMAALFSILSVYCYIYARVRAQRPRAWMFASALSLALGAISKESAWITPFLILLAEYGVCRNQRTMLRRGSDYVLLALPVLSLAYVVMDLLIGGAFYQYIQNGYTAREFTLQERLLTQPRVILFYLSQILWPLPGRFSIEHDFIHSISWFEPAATLPALLAVVAWCAVGVWLLFRQPYRVWGFFLLWLPACLVIESSAIPLEMVFEHRMYLPAFGLAGMLGLGLARLSRQADWLVYGVNGLLIVGLVSLIYSTTVRIPAWRSQIALYQAATINAPTSARVWTNLGKFYVAAEKKDLAEQAFTKAIALKPDKADAYLNRGHLYAENTSRLQEALHDLNRALALSPGLLRAYIARGNISAKLGHYEQALRDYETVLDAARNDVLNRSNMDVREKRFTKATAYYQQGIVYAVLRRYPQALQAYGNAIELRPDFSQAYHNRGSVYFRLNRFPEAIENFTRVTQSQPDDADAYFMRGKAHAALDQHQQALTDYARALQINPRDGEAYYRRGLSYRQLAEIQKATADFRRGCQLGVKQACGL